MTPVVATERNPSLWIATTEVTDYPALAQDVTTDVIVIGSGITGLTIARQLAGHGTRVVVLEARRLASGVTGFTTAKVTALHGATYHELTETWGEETASVYAEANQAGLAKIRELVAMDHIDCNLQEAAAYTYAESPDHVEQIEKEAEAARAAGLDATLVSESELPFPIARAVRLGGQAHFHPRRYCLGLAGAVTDAGGLIFEQSPVVDIDYGNLVATTAGGAKATARAIVLATQIPFVKRGSHYARMSVSRSYAIALRPKVAPIEHMYLSVDQPTRSLRCTDDGHLIVGGEGHPVGADEDTSARYAALEKWAEKWFPESTIEYQWSAQDYLTVDRLPYIGQLALGTERVFVATGFAKWGMTTGTAAAMLITDLIEGNPNPWAKTFDSTRLSLVQGGRRLVAGGASFVGHLVGDRLHTLTRPNADELEPGHGAIVDLNGAKVAAFRDDDGGLHAVSATCPHLGCQVAFNTAERSWDCPCHGSRFDVSGQVLQGPAVRGLGEAGTDAQSE
jgi:glycine/D-amino acid oxidase-like deaminating enzyme/nitrite reductase/ring-hydroxylating ferredoxin subunit